MFILDIIDNVAYLIFSWSWKVKEFKIFVSDYKEKFAAFCHIYYYLNFFVNVIINFKKVGNWNLEIE